MYISRFACTYLFHRIRYCVLSILLTQRWYLNPRCNPNDTLDIENLSNSSDSCTQILRDNSCLSLYRHTHPSLITLLSLSLSSYGCMPGNKTEFLASQNLTEEEFQEHPTINWDAILWVRRPLELWVVQVILAMVSLTEALLLAYLGYKVRYFFI